MKRVLAAAGLMIVLSGPARPAWASCPSIPDGPATGNVSNGIALAVCLQDDLAARAEAMREEARLRALIQQLERQAIEAKMAPLPEVRF